MRTLTNNIFTFRNKYWFNEVTRKPLGNEIYQKLEFGLGVFDAYERVNDAVGDLKEFYEEKRNRKIQDAITILTFVFVPLSAVISFWGMNFIDFGTWKWFLISFVIGAILTYFIFSLRKLWNL